MTTVHDIFAYLDERAPVRSKMDFDNVGLLVGHKDRSVHQALIALDITQEVIEEAVQLQAELLISHHPLFFELKSVSDSSLGGLLTLSLAEQGIAALCMHTNLDAAQGGVNDALMAALGGRTTDVLEPDTGIGRIGELPEPVELPAFLDRVKKILHCNGLRYVEGGRPVKHLAVCGGSGGGDVQAALKAGCDTLLTSDIKYHQFLEAKHFQINLIDADHFCTENVVVPVLYSWLKKAFPDVRFSISQTLKPGILFYT